VFLLTRTNPVIRGCARQLAEKFHMPLEKVRRTLKIAKEPLSLETPIGEEGDSNLGDLIEDTNAILPKSTPRSSRTCARPRRAYWGH